MRITDALLGEHSAFYMLFDQVELIVATESAIAQWRGATTVLHAMVDAHAKLEEDLLFSALEPLLGKKNGPLAVMMAEHEEMEHMLTCIEEETDVDRAAEWIPEALDAARSHFRKEEQVLFPMANRLLGEEALEQLGADWAKNRGVTVA